MSDKTWYLTCGISQLPITPEDPVAIFLLVRNQFIKGDIVNNPSSGFYDADNLYQPLTPAIKGQYRKHGRFQLLDSPLAIETVKQQVNRFLTQPRKVFSDEKIIQQYVDDMKTGYNRHLTEVDSFEKLMNKISAGSLPGISFMVVHQEIYDKMIELNALKKPHFNQKTELLIAMTHFMLADIENKKEKLKKSPIMKKKLRHTTIAPLLTGQFLIGNSDLANDFVDLFLIHDALYDNRKMWQPQAGTGGMENHYELTIAIGEFATKKYIHELKKKRQE